MRVISTSDLRAALHSSFGVTQLLVIATLALACVPISFEAYPSWAQDFSDQQFPSAISDDLSNEEIERNEERLKMLEDELLHTMDSKPDAIPRKTPTKTAIVLQEESPFARTLHEIAAHPVLRGKPNRASASVTSGVPSDFSDRPASDPSISAEELDILQRKLSVSDAALVRELESNFGAKAIRTSSTTNVGLRPRAPTKKSTGSVVAQRGRPVSNEWIVGRTSPKKEYKPKGLSITPAVSSDIDPPRWINNQRTSAIASVAVNNATLYIGPDRRQLALAPISKSSVVTVEKRRGEWYRVVTPTGHRGWLAGDSLLFNANVPRDSTVRVKAYKLRFEQMCQFQARNCFF